MNLQYLFDVNLDVLGAAGLLAVLLTTRLLPRVRTAHLLLLQFIRITLLLTIMQLLGVHIQILFRGCRRYLVLSAFFLILGLIVRF